MKEPLYKNLTGENPPQPAYIHKMRFFVSISIVFHVLAGSADEGFFFIETIPTRFSFAQDSKVIRSSALVTGAYSYKLSKTLAGAEKIEKWSKDHCKTPQTKIWHQASCEQVATCQAQGASDCAIDFQHSCGGAAVKVRGKVYLATARHCYDPEDQSSARFLASDGNSIESFPLKATALTTHKLPYDVALIEIENWNSNRPVAKISNSFSDGESVFAIGFPLTEERSAMAMDYPEAFSDMRISFGKIVNANLKGASYCHFSNEIDIAKPSTWILEPECSGGIWHSFGTGVDEYSARVEKDVLLTNTDMIHGMSGSALFNQNGDLLAFGTTTLRDSGPIDFEASIHAVYIKAIHIFDLIDSTP